MYTPAVCASYHDAQGYSLVTWTLAAGQLLKKLSFMVFSWAQGTAKAEVRQKAAATSEQQQSQRKKQRMSEVGV